MPNKMLIDATHPEETRVVVLRGNRVEEFDFESANRKQLRGNIYLAKVTRVEPSLQAAFVDYGGNRHGFLAFSEIHPDYYQIPVADRQALLAEEERAERAADADADHRARGGRGRNRHRHRGADRHRDVRRSEPLTGEEAPSEAAEMPVEAAGQPMPDEVADTAAVMAATTPAAELEAEQLVREAVEGAPGEAPMDAQPSPELVTTAESAAAPEAVESAEIAEPESVAPAGTAEPAAETTAAEASDPASPSRDDQAVEAASDEAHPVEAASNGENAAEASPSEEPNGDNGEEDEAVESVGGADALEEVQERLPRFRRQYKIQEVIKRRQVMLVQVVKEERGSKGAALTTYLSLAGRYSVLMPNTARGGGISRKITSAEDRGRLKEIAQELEVPEGMGVILRTAGASRTKAEVKRDFEYLLRLWETVRDLTLKSTAPKLVYEEGSLTKRSIRDLYNKDIDEIVVAGEEAYKDAKDFMRMLMPSHAKHVKLYKDTQPIFTRYAVESQLDAMFSPVVQLRSGGYIVINQAEALVAIDVNSGRATREHHIEDTALKTNGEAAEEIARQLRLRDLAGLIVIDFIDMDESRNNRTVERRLKESLKHDRARIQVGRISHFGLLEMSRQRIRTSVLESSTEKCPLCGGSGHVRSVSSVALQLLRALEEMLIKGATHNLTVRTRAEVALYVLNHKRAHLRELEERFRIAITVSADATITGQQSYIIDRGEQVHTLEVAQSLAAAAQQRVPVEDDDEVEPEEAEGEAPEAAQAESAQGDALEGQPNGDGEREDGHRPRRRRRGRGRGGEPREAREGGFAHETVAEHAIAHEDHNGGGDDESFAAEPQPQGAAPIGSESGEQRDVRRRRRRGRRGGRRNRQGRNGESPLAPRETGPDAMDNGEMTAVETGSPQPEPELQHAVADLDQPPPPEDAALPAADTAPAYAPPPTEPPAFTAPPPSPAPLSVEASEAEPPQRRGSTIREPAPFALGETPRAQTPTVPPPTPVISSTSGEDTGTPKRGWWAKRLLGDKG
jgi:ribonuclease E